MERTLKTLFITLFTLTLFTACGSKDVPDVQVSEAVFASHINNKAMPANINLKQEKTFLNRDYPIEVALFANGQWFYDLPNLGTGRGTYTYVDGKLQLFASRDLFDINIEVIAQDPEAKSFVLSFRDRFGQVVLQTELMNQEK